MDYMMLEPRTNECMVKNTMVAFLLKMNQTVLKKIEESREYGVDMKIHAFERGMQFNQIIEIIDGEITKEAEIRFKDYEWDCICPNVGG